MKEIVPVMKHVFILNPAAGKSDQTPRFSQDIDRICGKRGLDYEICVSKAPGDCRALARKACETGQEVRLYACGGDGTLNEVVCGMAGCPNAAVTHYPGGSGNDAIKVFSDTAPFFDLERLLDADETRFDLIRCNDTYCANILSIGLDAKIGTDMVRFKRLPLVTGKGAYILSIFSNMLHGLTAEYTVTLDTGEVLAGRKTMICICNGRWYGGSFNPVTDSEPDDGILDVLVVEKVNLLQVATVVGDYQKGRYRDHPTLIRRCPCRSLRIECAKKSVVNVDGEAVYTTDAKIEVVPQAVRFFYPKGLSYRAKNSQSGHKFAEITP